MADREHFKAELVTGEEPKCSIVDACQDAIERSVGSVRRPNSRRHVPFGQGH